MSYVGLRDHRTLWHGCIEPPLSRTPSVAGILVGGPGGGSAQEVDADQGQAEAEDADDGDVATERGFFEDIGGAIKEMIKNKKKPGDGADSGGGGSYPGTQTPEYHPRPPSAAHPPTETPNTSDSDHGYVNPEPDAEEGDGEGTAWTEETPSWSYPPPSTTTEATTTCSYSSSGYEVTPEPNAERPDYNKDSSDSDCCSCPDAESSTVEPEPLYPPGKPR